MQCSFKKEKTEKYSRNIHGRKPGVPSVICWGFQNGEGRAVYVLWAGGAVEDGGEEALGLSGI